MVHRLSHSAQVNVQSDTGANISITNNRLILHDITPTTFHVNSANNSGPQIVCKEIGLYDIITNNGDKISTPMYYSPSASGTILSPDNVCTQSTNSFYRFDVIHNIESGFGHIHFVSHDNNDSFIDMTRRNGLWYFHNHQLAIVQDPTKSPTANVLTQKILESELWHHRFGHPGERGLQQTTKCVDGLPSRFEYHPFRACEVCMDAKPHKHPLSKATDDENL